MKSFLLLLSGILVSGIILTGTSCRKETDCTAVIKCTDSTGVALSNATVELFAIVKDPSDPLGTNSDTADVRAKGTTNSSGEVSFVFKLPATFDIKGSIPIGAKTYTGSGIIKLVEGETERKTVQLK